MKIKQFLKNNTIILIAVLCVLSFSIGYFGSMFAEKLEENQTKISAASDNEELIQPTTSIVLIRQYTKTDSVNIKQVEPTSEMIGKDIDYIISAYEGWEIGSFSKEKISLYKTIDSYPPGTFLVTSIISQEDGQEVLAVYEYDIDGVLSLKESFDTHVELLPESEIVKVLEGIIVNNEDELSSLLENYAE